MMKTVMMMVGDNGDDDDGGDDGGGGDNEGDGDEDGDGDCSDGSHHT